jgi:hypothetical protein
VEGWYESLLRCGMLQSELDYGCRLIRGANELVMVMSDNGRRRAHVSANIQRRWWADSTLGAWTQQSVRWLGRQGCRSLCRGGWRGRIAQRPRAGGEMLGGSIAGSGACWD